MCGIPHDNGDDVHDDGVKNDEEVDHQSSLFAKLTDRNAEGRAENNDTFAKEAKLHGTESTNNIYQEYSDHLCIRQMT
jgi:hypothetical protein